MRTWSKLREFEKCLIFWHEKKNACNFNCIQFQMHVVFIVCNFHRMQSIIVARNWLHAIWIHSFENLSFVYLDKENRIKRCLLYTMWIELNWLYRFYRSFLFAQLIMNENVRKKTTINKRCRILQTLIDCEIQKLKSWKFWQIKWNIEFDRCREFW